MKFSLLVLALLLTACSGTQQIKYPAKLNNQQDNNGSESQLSTAKSAYIFKDKDIAVPANFETQNLDECNFDLNNENDNCPLKKPVIRVYFDGNDDKTNNVEEAQVLKQLNNEKLGLIFESQLAGLNRFRVVTKDDQTKQEIKRQIKELSAKEVATQLKSKKVLRPDYLLKIDTIKTAERFYAEYNGMAQYSVELTISIIDPYTKEKLAYPNIGKVRINGTDVKAKQELVYTQVNDRYYTGFDYTNSANVNGVFSKIVSKAFDVVISRLLTEMPATAQVLAFRNGQVTLDRGRNSGILNQDTLILFRYSAGFVDPIAVAVATPSSESAIGQIVRWKNNEIAKEIQKKSKGGIFKSSDKIFAVSVGLPESYLKSRF